MSAPAIKYPIHCTHLFTSRDIPRRDIPSCHLTLEICVLAHLLFLVNRLDVPHDTSELPSTTGLLSVCVRKFTALRDSLAERNTRLASDAGDAVLTLHALHVDIQV